GLQPKPLIPTEQHSLSLVSCGAGIPACLFKPRQAGMPAPPNPDTTVPIAPQGEESPPVAERPTSRPPDRYLSFFSRFPSMSNSVFMPPFSTAPFPLSLSPVIVNLYSTVSS